MIEDVELRSSRGLDRSMPAALSSCAWITGRHNLIITGPTGVGKSWLACAFGQKACREGHSVLYHRLGRLFTELGISRGDGRFLRVLRMLSQVDLLILDDWGLAPASSEQCRDPLEILEDRHGRKSILITSQLPDWIGAHTRALTFFGGVPELIVPDNLKSGVTKASYYDPEINPTYQHWADHFGVAIENAAVKAAVRGDRLTMSDLTSMCELEAAGCFDGRNRAKEQVGFLPFRQRR